LAGEENHIELFVCLCLLPDCKTNDMDFKIWTEIMDLKLKSALKDKSDNFLNYQAGKN
jgi:hypothetical protein